MIYSSATRVCFARKSLTKHGVKCGTPRPARTGHREYATVAIASRGDSIRPRNSGYAKRCHGSSKVRPKQFCGRHLQYLRCVPREALVAVAMAAMAAMAQALAKVRRCVVEAMVVEAKRTRRFGN